MSEPEQPINPPEPQISETEMAKRRQRLIGDIMDVLNESKLSDYIDDIADAFDMVHAITQDRDDDKLGRIDDMFDRIKMRQAEYLADTMGSFYTDRTLDKMKVEY